MNRNIILTKDDLWKRVKYFQNFDAFAFDVETMPAIGGTQDDRLQPTTNTVVWVSFATHGQAFTVPIGHPNGDRLVTRAYRRKNRETGRMDLFDPVYDEPPEQLRPSVAFDILSPLLLSEKHRKIAHNAPFDIVSVAKYYGEIPPGPYTCTATQMWLINENNKQVKLKPTIEHRFGVAYDPDDTGKKIEIHPFSKVGRYSILDSKYTWLLDRDDRPKIAPERLERVQRVEEDLTGVICSMYVEGAAVDEETLEELRVELSAKVVDLEGKIYKRAGKKFNLNSQPQKCHLLFDSKEEGGQGIRPFIPTDGGKKKEKAGQDLDVTDYSTADDILEQYIDNPLVKSMLDYAEVNKLLGTYVLGYLGEEDNPKKPRRIFDGRIHADLRQYGTVSGRFSCRTPNLQNIPRPDTELGKKIRGLFIAPTPDHRLVVADYGQIEMVILAHFAGPGALFYGILDGMDPHSATAAALAGMDAQEFMDMVRNEDPKAKKMRFVAKGINFAVVYGAGAAKVASMAEISKAEAKRFLQIHERQFPEVYEFKDKVIDVCRSRRPPHVKTILGRKRRLPTIFSKDEGLRKYAERQAVNSIVQGSAADIIKMAMIRLDATLEDDMRLILSVHDELVTTCPVDRTDECEAIVHEAMLGTGITKFLNVPLTLDMKSVYRWSEAK